MTSQNFIEAVVNGRITREKSVSSIYYDGNDTIYSYGTHYPLLFKIAGKWFLNDRGYSNTTAKHIGWASRYADYVLSLKDGGGSYGYRAVSPTLENAKESVEEEIAQILPQLLNLRKGAFRKEAMLKHRLEQLEATNAELNRIANLELAYLAN